MYQTTQEAVDKNRDLDITDIMRNIVNSYVFVDVAEVTGVYQDKFVNCKIGKNVYNYVELLSIGAAKTKVSLIPERGDSVLLFCPRTSAGYSTNLAANPIPFVYSKSNMKCIPILSGTADNVISLKKDSFEATYKGNKITLSSNGIKLEGQRGTLEVL